MTDNLTNDLHGAVDRIIRHADAWEVRQCAAELRNRAASHLRRAKEIESAFAGIGGVL